MPVRRVALAFRQASMNPIEREWVKAQASDAEVVRQEQFRQQVLSSERASVAQDQARLEASQRAYFGYSDRELRQHNAAREAERQARIGELVEQLGKLSPEFRDWREGGARRSVSAYDDVLARAEAVDADGYMAAEVSRANIRAEEARRRSFVSMVPVPVPVSVCADCARQGCSMGEHRRLCC